MNRKYYFNNMWWGWVTGGYMLYMSWDYDFKYRLLFWCISLCGMVLYPVAKWYIEDTALKFTRPDFWNSGFFADTPGKMGLLAVYTGTVFILSLPLSMIYILSVIIKRLSVREAACLIFYLNTPELIRFFHKRFINQRTGDSHQ